MFVAELDTVCRFVQSQSVAKGSVWHMIMAKDIFAKLELIRLVFYEMFNVFTYLLDVKD